MKLKVNSPYETLILSFAWLEFNVCGNEVELAGTRVFDLLSKIKLENYIEEELDESVNLPADLKFIGVNWTQEDLNEYRYLRRCDEEWRKENHLMLKIL